MTKTLGWGLGLAAALAFGTAARAQSAAGSAGSSETPTPGSATPVQPQGDTAGTADKAGTASTAQGAAGQKQLPKALRDAAEKLHAANQAEIQEGQMAEQQAQNDAVKDFAKRMVQDHQQNDQQLQQMAPSLGITSVEGTAFQKATKTAQSDLKKLQGKQGADFDKAYMSMAVKDHQKDLKEVDSAAKKAQKTQPQLAQFLGQTRDTVRSHLQEARRVEQQVKSEGKGEMRQGRRGATGSMGGPSSGTQNAYGAGMQDNTKATGQTGANQGAEQPSGSGSSGSSGQQQGR